MEKLKEEKTSGISLVALVITIIVLIILTGAVIVTFMEGGIISRAKEATFKNDIRTYQEILTMKKADEYIDIATGKKVSSDLNGEKIEEIQDFIPEFKKEYEGLIRVVEGELVLAEEYEEVATKLEQEWLAELGIGEKEWDNSQYDWFVIDEGTGKLSGFKEEYKKYYDSINNYTVDEQYTSIIIPNTVKSIEAGAFEICRNLKSVVIPKSVTRIEGNAFLNCTAIENIVIPNSVTYIGDSAFGNCNKASNIVIPKNVTYIGDCAFENMDSITSITIPGSVTEIGVGAFMNSNSLKTVKIEEGVTSISEMMFCESVNIETISLPSTITFIGGAAFYKCNIKTITIPEKVETIDYFAFGECNYLESVVIPKSVATLGEGAFLDCPLLNSIIVEAGSTLTQEDFTFAGITDMSIISFE